MTFPLRPIDDAVPDSAHPGDFADAMSALASGVVLVTCWVDDRPWGMTVTAVASVSADPPTVLVSLGSHTTGAHAITATGQFGVSILAEGQLVVAGYGSAPSTTKYLEPLTEWRDDRNESPVLAAALAHVDCEVTETVQIADHTVFFGRVRAARAARGGTPLVYHRRAYRKLAAPASKRPPTRRSPRCLSS